MESWNKRRLQNVGKVHTFGSCFRRQSILMSRHSVYKTKKNSLQVFGLFTRWNHGVQERVWCQLNISCSVLILHLNLASFLTVCKMSIFWRIGIENIIPARKKIDKKSFANYRPTAFKKFEVICYEPKQHFLPQISEIWSVYEKYIKDC